MEGFAHRGYLGKCVPYSMGLVVTIKVFSVLLETLPSRTPTFPLSPDVLRIPQI